MSATPHTEPTQPQAESVSKSANNGRVARFPPWPLRLTALTLAMLSLLWLCETLLRDRTCERLSHSAISISFAAYYALLAAGALSGRRGNSFDLRSGPLVA